MHRNAGLMQWVRTLLGTALLLAGTSRAAAEDAQVLADDFEDGDALGWAHAGASWSIASVSGSGFKVAPGFTSTITTAGSTSWTDYSVEARIDHVGGTGTERFGLVFRYTDAQNYYLLHYNSAIDRWDLRRSTTAGGEVLLERVEHGLFPNSTKHVLRVTVDGPSIRAFLDGQPLLEETDIQLTAGSVGLYSNKGTVVFDDVRVEENEGSALLWDGFEDGDAGGWSGFGVDTRWTIAATSSQALQAAPGFDAASSVTGDALWDDFEFEAKVRPVFSSASTARYGIVFRHRDAANYYLLYFNGGIPSWDLKRVSSEQGEAVVGRLSGASFAAATEHVLKVDARGPSIRAFVDGQLLFTETDATIGAGQIGVYTTKATVAFDDVRVSKPPVSQDSVIAYPLAAYEDHTPGAVSYGVTVNGTTVPVHPLLEGGYAHFAFSGQARIQVTVDASTYPSFDYKLSPEAFGIAHAHAGNQITFTIARPMQLVLTLDDGDPVTDDRLFLLADSLEDADTPKLGDAGVVDVRLYDTTSDGLSATELATAVSDTAGTEVLFFPAGEYALTQTWHLPEDSNVYLAPGAFLRRVGELGSMITLDGDNVTLRGRGTIDGLAATAEHRSTAISDEPAANHVHVDGLVFKEIPGCTMGLNGTDHTLRNLKSISVVYSYPNLADQATRSCGIFPGAEAVLEDSIITAYDDDMNWSPSSTPYHGLTVRNVVGIENDARFLRARAIHEQHSLALENIYMVETNRFVELTNAGNAEFYDLFFKNVHVEVARGLGFQLRMHPEASVVAANLGLLRNAYFQDWYASPGASNEIYSRNVDLPVADVFLDNFYEGGVLATPTTGADIIPYKAGSSGADYADATVPVFGATDVPFVSVDASDMYASTVGPSPGMFTFRRSVSNASALVLPITVRGSATPGVDYQALPSSITIPAGKSSLSVVITPIAHGQTDVKTVYVSIDSSGFNTEYLLAPATRPSCSVAGCGVGKSHQAVVSIGVQ